MQAFDMSFLSYCGAFLPMVMVHEISRIILNLARK